MKLEGVIKAFSYTGSQIVLSRIASSGEVDVVLRPLVSEML